MNNIQTQILQDLKDKFCSLSQSELSSGGLIDVNSIIQKANEDIIAKESIVEATKAFTRLMQEDIRRHVFMIQKDIEALGLSISISKVGDYIDIKAGALYGIRIRYNHSTYKNVTFDNCSRSYPVEYKITLKADYLYDIEFKGNDEGFKELVSNERFKLKLRELYELLQNKNDSV
jgi:hypothetical protein